MNCFLYRCKKWVISSRLEKLDSKSAEELYRNYSLCSNHFEDSQFMNAKLKNKLIKTALPALFDVPNPPPIVTPQRRSVKRSLDQPKPASKRTRGIITYIYPVLLVIFILEEQSE